MANAYDPTYSHIRRQSFEKLNARKSAWYRCCTLLAVSSSYHSVKTPSPAGATKPPAFFMSVVACAAKRASRSSTLS